jgi:ketosteroid isomerase-like protein
MTDLLQRTQAIYEAFGTGDVDGILSALAPDVTWSNAGPADLEYFGVRHGRAEVAGVFAIIGREFDIAEFAPVEFFTTGNRVAVLLRQRTTIRSTGKSFAEDLVHVWTYGEDGLVRHLQDIQDSAAIAEAMRP